MHMPFLISDVVAIFYKEFTIWLRCV